MNLGQPQLRALAVSEILDKSLRLYRVHFAVFFGIAAVALIPEGILEFLIILSGMDVTRLQTALTSLFSAIASMALIVAISNAYLNRDFTIRSSYSTGLGRFWSVIGANILVGAAIAAPLFLVMICLLMAEPMLFFVVLLFWLPVAVFLSTRWSLSSQVIILEDKGATQGLKRTWDLTKDYFWRVLGTSFAASLLSSLLTLLPFLFADYVLGFTGLSYMTIQLIELVIQQLALVVVLPFTVAVQVLIYYDLRIRKEGFDLLMRATAEPIGDQPAA